MMMENALLPAFPGPQLAGPARADTPFVAAGRRALATGWAATGIEELWVYPFRALRRLRVEGASPAHSARMTPAGFERRFLVDGREVLERIFVPAAAPLALLEWVLLPAVSTSGPCLDPLDLELTWECDLARAETALPPLARPEALRAAGAIPLHATVHARHIVVEQGEPGGPLHGVAAFQASRALAAGAEALPPTRGRPNPGLLCRAGVRLVPGERVTLTVSAAPETTTLGDGAGPELDASALVAARVADGQRRSTERLSLSATDPLAGQALRWAALRLPAYLADLSGSGSPRVAAGYAPGTPPRPSAGAALRVGLASLALGDAALAVAMARATLEEAEAADRPLGEATAGAPVRVPPATATLLLFAQHFLWTGSPDETRTAWPRLLELARALAGGTAGAPEQTTALIACALGQLALVAESMGQVEDAAALRAAAAALGRGEAVAAALAEAGGWKLWQEGAAAGAYRAWRTLAESGLGPARALWPGAAGPDDASAAARVVGGVA
ncbi:MAG TPA: hypothetical protein VF832_19975, partial [Longimicrobiales bacterium]